MKFIDVKAFTYTIFAYVFVLFLFILFRLRVQKDCKFKKKKANDIVKSLKTGDVLAVGYGSKRAKLVKIFTGSMWAHSAVIIRMPECKPYVLEVGRYSREERGIMVTPFKDWIKKNEGHTVAMAKYCGPPIDDEKVKKFLSEHEGVREEMFVAKWLSAMIKVRHPVKINKNKKFYCSELVTHFLQEVGVMKRKYHPSGYKPWEVLYGNRHLKEGVKYATPVLIE